MAFAWDARQFRTLSGFINYLWSLPKINWGNAEPNSVTVHHTWKPTIESWRGMASMAALEVWYRDQVPWTDANGNPQKGWSAAPHLFVAIGSPNPEHDGIFIGTPLTSRGVHAGVCNSGFGFEVVGNHDLAPWSTTLEGVMVDLVGAILDKQGMAASAVKGHRECGSSKTCPGTKVDMNHFRSLLTNRTIDPWTLWGSDFPLPVDQRPWDMNQRWLERRAELGEARSHPVYINDGRGTVIRMFERGLVIDDDFTRGKSWTFAELLR